MSVKQSRRGKKKRWGGKAGQSREARVTVGCPGPLVRVRESRRGAAGWRQPVWGVIQRVAAPTGGSHLAPWTPGIKAWAGAAGCV